MELRTISQVSKEFNISTRTLRYYEQIGLIKSAKKDDYAYRVYDGDTLLRLRQVVILRKLRIPLKKIITILENGSSAEIIEAFQQNLSDIDDEITALSTIRSILKAFVTRLNENAHLNIQLALLDDISILDIVDSLTVTKINFKEEKTMEELNKANESLSKLTDVRIVYLPPATVASSHHIGDDPEDHAGLAMDKFVRDSKLCELKPDLRHYGFNNPNPVDESNFHGYEMWVTIPDDMEVPAPLVKKHFDGGLYAAHMIPMGNFHEWEWLDKWVQKSDKYDYNGSGDYKNMFGALEEHLNYINHVRHNTEIVQLDLLIPIKEK